MIIRKHIRNTLLLSVICLTSAQFASAEGFALNSKPTKCISLNEGLVCYQKIQMQWQAPVIDNYCLIQLSSNRPLKCWVQQIEGHFKFEFADRKSQAYALRRQAKNVDLANIHIDVKWVYKAKYRDGLRWKVF